MTLNLAISGAGYIADIHAQAIRSLPDVRLSALVEYFPEKAKTFALKYEIPNLYSDMKELIQAGGVDGIILGVPNALHAPQTIAALEAGIAVMVEKPMAMNVSEAEEMAKASRKTGIPLMVAHCWRFHDEAQWLRNQAMTGRLGKIIRTKGYGVHVNWGPSGWFTQKSLAGGGALADLGIHAIDTVRYLLDDPNPISVYARIGTNYLSADVDDTGILIINWDNGVSSYIESGWWQPHADGPEASTQLYGIKGFGSLFPTVLSLPNAAKQRVEKVDPGFEFPQDPHCPHSMYNQQMAYFVDCIRKGMTPNPGAAEGLVNMRIIEAAHQSSQSGKVVEL